MRMEGGIQMEGAQQPAKERIFCAAFGADLTDRIFSKNAARFFGRE
jgi:hypothetical protein